MRMTRHFIMSACLLLPMPLLAQALTVMGGDAWANSCYENAEYATNNSPLVSRSLLEPCDSALDYGTLSLSDRAATFANRGIIHAATKNITAAMADYEKAVGIRPETPEIYVNRGNAYFLNMDYAMALADYEHSLELGIRQIHFVRYNMGMAYEKLGNDDAAERQFRSALEIEPGWQLVEDRLERLLQRRAEDAADQQ